jgi:transposase InsO family protein
MFHAQFHAQEAFVRTYGPGGRVRRLTVRSLRQQARRARCGVRARAPHRRRSSRKVAQMDCFCIGRLSGTKGTVWQYNGPLTSLPHTADLHVAPRTPAARWTSAVAQRGASDLAARGWNSEVVMSDNASEFRSQEFERVVDRLGARHPFQPRGAPEQQRLVERVQDTILEECWKPAFARYLIPKYTGFAPGPGALPPLLPHRPRAQGALHPWSHSRAGPGQGQDVDALAQRRRDISGTGHTR